MKKFSLLLLPIIAMLAGCNAQASVIDNTNYSTDTIEEKSNIFPVEEIKEDLLEIGITDFVPIFSGSAISYEYFSEYKELVIEVDADTEKAAITTYSLDFLNANYDVEKLEDDIYCLSQNKQLEVYIYEGLFLDRPGSIVIDFYKYEIPTTGFPLNELNGFLNTYELGFNVEQELPILKGNKFAYYSNIIHDLHYFNIGALGNLWEVWEEALAPILINAGYTLYTFTEEEIAEEEDEYETYTHLYINSIDHQVAFSYNFSYDMSRVSFFE